MFTDEELSRILSCHEEKSLITTGSSGKTYHCIFQAATLLNYTAEMMDWFDTSYNISWTVDEFSDKLQNKINEVMK